MPTRSSSAPESTRPFGSASGGPSSTIGSPGPHELERLLTVGGADVDPQRLPRELALVRRDDDPANLAGRPS